MKPEFSAGNNIAMKVPQHEFEVTVAFYRDVLGFKVLNELHDQYSDSVIFEFGDKQLWVDRVDHLSQTEIWLEVSTNSRELAEAYLKDKSCVRRDEIESLPDGFKGFWVSSPSNIIHLISEIDN